MRKAHGSYPKAEDVNTISGAKKKLIQSRYLVFELSNEPGQVCVRIWDCFAAWLQYYLSLSVPLKAKLEKIVQRFVNYHCIKKNMIWLKTGWNHLDDVVSNNWQINPVSIWWYADCPCTCCVRTSPSVYVCAEIHLSPCTVYGLLGIRFILYDNNILGRGRAATWYNCRSTADRNKLLDQKRLGDCVVERIYKAPFYPWDLVIKKNHGRTLYKTPAKKHRIITRLKSL